MLKKKKSGVMTKRMSDKDIYKLRTSFDELFKERNEFYNSPRFDEITDIIKREDLVNQEDLKYHANMVKDLTYEEFSKFCNTLYWKKKTEVVELKPHLFNLEYKGIQVFMSTGQRSSFYAKKIETDLK